MRLVICLGPLCLSFRKSLDLAPMPAPIPRPTDPGSAAWMYEHPIATAIARYEIPGTRIVIGGGVGSAEDWATLTARGVTHCLCVTDPPDVGVPAELALHAPIPDEGQPFPRELLARVVGYARKVLTEDGKLYLHCWVGASRSPSFAYAVMREVYGMGGPEAVAAINTFYPYGVYGQDPKHQSYMVGIDEWIAGRVGIRANPAGMSGTDYGTLRIAECLRDAGHQVTLRTVSAEAGTTWNGIEVIGPDATIPECDAVIAINEPDLLRDSPAGAFRLCITWLNDWSFCRSGFHEHVDLFASCSVAHLEQFRMNSAWHRVEVTPEHPNGKETFAFDASKWCVVPLGCDPENFGALPGEAYPLGPKVPAKVVYCSSPDRGLHWLLQEWPAIKAAVPHATLSIFYRLEPWLRSWDNTPHFPPIEPLRSRALYIEECLRRFKAAGGMGVTVRDSVSRDVIEREMASAEVLGFPCDTTTWSEGFSCTILECCAARACPIITDCDALGEVYASIDHVPMGDGWQAAWREKVIRALTDADFRADVNEKARALAEKLTWKTTAAELVAQIERVRK